jgi:hypothetical protein
MSDFIGPIDLRPYGWAPGGYMLRCSDCPDDLPFKDMPTGAKRSWRCEEHARAKFERERQLRSEHIPFNVNYYVRVKLNHVGRDILRKRHEQLQNRLPSIGDYPGEKTDEFGFTRFQLWDLMQTFGPHISLGSNPPFETEILIPKDPR